MDEEEVTNSADELGVMSQFMDVITTFKCKACDYICHRQQHLIDHVKTAHLASATSTSDSQDSQTAVADQVSPHSTDHSKKRNSQEATANAEIETVLTSGAADAANASASTNLIADLVTEAQQELVGGVSEQPELVGGVSEQPQLAGGVSGQPELVGGVSEQPQLVGGVSGHPELVGRVSEQPLETYLQQQVPGTAVVVPASAEQIVFVEAAPSVANSLFTPDEFQQKEVFLCGHCNMGFRTIEDCKEHMVKAHEMNIEDLESASTLTPSTANTQTLDQFSQSEGLEETSVTPAPATESEVPEQTFALISEREEMPNGKISMATQVIRKKVGRKSKAELLEIQKQKEAAEAAAAEAKKEEEDEGSTVKVSAKPGIDQRPNPEVDETNEEFEDAQQIYVEIEIPGKRKRRLPKHLTSDYLIQKSRRLSDDTDYIPPGTTTSRSTRTSNKPKIAKPNMPHKCDVLLCKAKLPTEEALSYHSKTHTGKVDSKGFPVLSCPEEKCGSTFQTSVWKDFKYHSWKEHKIDLGMIPCDVCDYRATLPSKLAIHKETHRADRPYQCEICFKGFKQQSQLTNHSLVHLAGIDIKEKESMSGRHWFVQAQCQICKRTFANQKSLVCHVEAVHEKVKPFECKFCGHTAARKAMMQLHMRTHTGEKPFKCDICPFQTGDHNSLRRHKMRHTGDKPYHCPHCSYSCIQAVSLKLHLKSKHPGSDSCYSCNKCAYRTVNKTLYTNHVRDHEMGLIDEVDIIPCSESPAAAIAAQKAAASQYGYGRYAVKLGPINDLTNGGSNTTQLICSALNAIAPSIAEDDEPLPENIETTITTISEQDGIKAHKIIFYIPATLTKNAKTAEVVVQESQPVLDPSAGAQILDPMQETGGSMDVDVPTAELTLDETNSQSLLQPKVTS